MERITRGIRESVRERVARFDRVFKPLTSYRSKPVLNAILASHPADADISKETLADWIKQGVNGRFWHLLEQRESLYFRSFAGMMNVGSNLVMWAALNDLCADTGEVGAYARRYRAIRVKEVLAAEREGVPVIAGESR